MMGNKRSPSFQTYLFKMSDGQIVSLLMLGTLLLLILLDFKPDDCWVDKSFHLNIKSGILNKLEIKDISTEKYFTKRNVYMAQSCFVFEHFEEVKKNRINMETRDLVVNNLDNKQTKDVQKNGINFGHLKEICMRTCNKKLEVRRNVSLPKKNIFEIKEWKENQSHRGRNLFIKNFKGKYPKKENAFNYVIFVEFYKMYSKKSRETIVENMQPRKDFFHRHFFIFASNTVLFYTVIRKAEFHLQSSPLFVVCLLSQGHFTEANKEPVKSIPQKETKNQNQTQWNRDSFLGETHYITTTFVSTIGSELDKFLKTGDVVRFIFNLLIALTVSLILCILNIVQIFFWAATAFESLFIGAMKFVVFHSIATVLYIAYHIGHLVFHTCPWLWSCFTDIFPNIVTFIHNSSIVLTEYIIIAIVTAFEMWKSVVTMLWTSLNEIVMTTWKIYWGCMEYSFSFGMLSYAVVISIVQYFIFCAQHFVNFIEDIVCYFNMLRIHQQVLYEVNKDFPDSQTEAEKKWRQMEKWNVLQIISTIFFTNPLIECETKRDLLTLSDYQAPEDGGLIKHWFVNIAILRANDRYRLWEEEKCRMKQFKYGYPHIHPQTTPSVWYGSLHDWLIFIDIRVRYWPLGFLPSILFILFYPLFCLYTRADHIAFMAKCYEIETTPHPRQKTGFVYMQFCAMWNSFFLWPIRLVYGIKRWLLYWCNLVADGFTGCFLICGWECLAVMRRRKEALASHPITIMFSTISSICSAFLYLACVCVWIPNIFIYLWLHGAVYSIWEKITGNKNEDEFDPFLIKWCNEKMTRGVVIRPYIKEDLVCNDCVRILPDGALLYTQRPNSHYTCCVCLCELIDIGPSPYDPVMYTHIVKRTKKLFFSRARDLMERESGKFMQVDPGVGSCFAAVVTVQYEDGRISCKQATYQKIGLYWTKCHNIVPSGLVVSGGYQMDERLYQPKEKEYEIQRVRIQTRKGKMTYTFRNYIGENDLPQVKATRYYAWNELHKSVPLFSSKIQPIVASETWDVQIKGSSGDTLASSGSFFINNATKISTVLKEDIDNSFWKFKLLQTIGGKLVQTKTHEKVLCINKPKSRRASMENTERGTLEGKLNDVQRWSTSNKCVQCSLDTDCLDETTSLVSSECSNTECDASVSSEISIRARDEEYGRYTNKGLKDQLNAKRKSSFESLKVENMTDLNDTGLEYGKENESTSDFDASSRREVRSSSWVRKAKRFFHYHEPRMNSSSLSTDKFGASDNVHQCVDYRNIPGPSTSGELLTAHVTQSENMLCLETSIQQCSDSDSSSIVSSDSEQEGGGVDNVIARVRSIWVGFLSWLGYGPLHVRNENRVVKDHADVDAEALLNQLNTSAEETAFDDTSACEVDTSAEEPENQVERNDEEQSMTGRTVSDHSEPNASAEDEEEESVPAPTQLQQAHYVEDDGFYDVIEVSPTHSDNDIPREIAIGAIPIQRHHKFRRRGPRPTALSHYRPSDFNTCLINPSEKLETITEDVVTLNTENNSPREISPKSANGLEAELDELSYESDLSSGLEDILDQPAPIKVRGSSDCESRYYSSEGKNRHHQPGVRRKGCKEKHFWKRIEGKDSKEEGSSSDTDSSFTPPSKWHRAMLEGRSRANETSDSSPPDFENSSSSDCNGHSCPNGDELCNENENNTESGDDEIFLYSCNRILASRKRETQNAGHNAQTLHVPCLRDDCTANNSNDKQGLFDRKSVSSLGSDRRHLSGTKNTKDWNRTLTQGRGVWYGFGLHGVWGFGDGGLQDPSTTGTWQGASEQGFWQKDLDSDYSLDKGFVTESEGNVCGIQTDISIPCNISASPSTPTIPAGPISGPSLTRHRASISLSISSTRSKPCLSSHSSSSTDDSLKDDDRKAHRGVKVKRSRKISDIEAKCLSHDTSKPDEESSGKNSELSSQALWDSFSKNFEPTQVESEPEMNLGTGSVYNFEAKTQRKQRNQINQQNTSAPSLLPSMGGARVVNQPLNILHTPNVENRRQQVVPIRQKLIDVSRCRRCLAAFPFDAEDLTQLARNTYYMRYLENSYEYPEDESDLGAVGGVSVSPHPPSDEELIRIMLEYHDIHTPLSSPSPTSGLSDYRTGMNSPPLVSPPDISPNPSYASQVSGFSIRPQIPRQNLKEDPELDDTSRREQKLQTSVSLVDIKGKPIAKGSSSGKKKTIRFREEDTEEIRRRTHGSLPREAFNYDDLRFTHSTLQPHRSSLRGSMSRNRGNKTTRFADNTDHSQDRSE